MSLSAISSVSSAAALETVSKPVQPATQPAAAAATPQDTVTLSPAALKASQGGDVDHDGDSH